MPAYVYGEKWLVRNQRTREIYTSIGMMSTMSKGKQPDNTPLSELGIFDGDVLEVVEPPRSK